MTTPFQQTLYLNIPVSSLAKALPFYKALGMTQNMMFSSDDTACMTLSPTLSVMVMETYVSPLPSAAPCSPFSYPEVPQMDIRC
jgi:uncharacterized protein